MKSQYGWVLCPLLLAYCDRLKLREADGEELSSTSIRCIYAEREFQTSSSEALSAVVGATSAINSKDGDEKDSEELARHAEKANRNQVSDVRRQLSDNHPDKMLPVLGLTMKKICQGRLSMLPITNNATYSNI
jgi:hypothetical protein